MAVDRRTVLSSDPFGDYGLEKGDSKPRPLRKAKKKWMQRLKTVHSNTGLPVKTHEPGNSVLRTASRYGPITIVTSEIWGSPNIWETMTFLWPMFQSPVSTSHLIKCTF